MSFLRSLRNLAVLVILTVAVLSLNPRLAAAQSSSCRPLGHYCTSGSQCCSHLCGRRHTCCDKLSPGQYCSSSAECCNTYCTVGHFCR